MIDVQKSPNYKIYKAVGGEGRLKRFRYIRVLLPQEFNEVENKI